MRRDCLPLHHGIKPTSFINELLKVINENIGDVVLLSCGDPSMTNQLNVKHTSEALDEGETMIVAYKKQKESCAL